MPAAMPSGMRATSDQPGGQQEGTDGCRHPDSAGGGDQRGTGGGPGEKNRYAVPCGQDRRACRLGEADGHHPACGLFAGRSHRGGGGKDKRDGRSVADEGRDERRREKG
jgi:hypothetical protein